MVYPQVARSYWKQTHPSMVGRCLATRAHFQLIGHSNQRIFRKPMVRKSSTISWECFIIATYCYCMWNGDAGNLVSIIIAWLIRNQTIHPHSSFNKLSFFHSLNMFKPHDITLNLLFFMMKCRSQPSTAQRRQGAHPEDSEEDQEDHKQTGLGRAASYPPEGVSVPDEKWKFEKRGGKKKLLEFAIAVFEYQGRFDYYTNSYLYRYLCEMIYWMFGTCFSCITS